MENNINREILRYLAEKIAEDMNLRYGTCIFHSWVHIEVVEKTKEFDLSSGQSTQLYIFVCKFLRTMNHKLFADD